MSLQPPPIPTNRPVSRGLIRTVLISLVVTVVTCVPVVAAWVHLMGRVLSAGPTEPEPMSPVIYVAGFVGALASAVFCVSLFWLIVVSVARTLR